MRNVLPHAWEPIRGGAWMQLCGKPYGAVRTNTTPRGFLWTHGKQYGYAATLDLAKEWVEAAREFWPRKV